MNYTYQTISHQDLPNYKEAILEFFSHYRYPEDYSLAVDNSAFIAVCWDKEKIVGAGRVVSDLSRFALIVDLNVLKDYQKQGIGKKLVEEMVQACLAANIRYIELSSDPRYPWLEDFYTKIGFQKITDSAHFAWPRRQ